MVWFCCEIYFAALKLLESYSVHFKNKEKGYSDSREANGEKPVFFYLA